LGEAAPFLTQVFPGQVKLNKSTNITQRIPCDRNKFVMTMPLLILS